MLQPNNLVPTLEQKKAQATDAAKHIIAATLSARATIAARRFLEEKKDFTIKAINYECSAGTVELIARDEDGVLRFVKVNVAEGKLPEEPTSEADRKRLERIALSYLAENEELPGGIAFDCVSMAAIRSKGELKKAMLKYHSNLFN